MDIEFSGAARQVTGSCHVVRAAGRTIFLDCGMFQGRRSEADAANRKIPVPVTAIDAVVVSHAHLDHTGRLPLLAKLGYKGPIFATPATADLAAVLLQDSAHIQESDAAFLKRQGKPAVEPLYTIDDASHAMTLARKFEYDVWFDVVPGVRGKFSNAGHILGSASITLAVTENGATTHLVFSGDVGRWGQLIITDPVPPSDGADVVLMESTYADRDHGTIADARVQLGRIVRDTAARGGRVLIPAFAVGRSQEVIYDLHSLARDGLIPKIPIVIDSPLAVRVTQVFEQHRELLDQTEPLVREVPDLFSFDQLRFTENVEDSKKLNTETGPMVIIAGSGMCESGRIVHHLLHGASNSKNTIVMVGYQAENTLGRRIEEHQRTLHIFDTHVPLHAQVEVLTGYSAHADRDGLNRWLDAVHAKAPELKQVCLVHGEAASQDTMAVQLRARGYKVVCPQPGSHLKVSAAEVASAP